MTIALLIDRRENVEPITVPLGRTVGQVVALLTERKIGAVPVVEDDAVVGIVSERDIVTCLAHEGAAILDHPVEKIMTAPVITVERDTTVLAALSLMTSRRIRHLPVLEAGRLIGVVSIGDLVKYRLDKIEAEAEALRSYIQSV
jgi:CBS domain-containing protein